MVYYPRDMTGFGRHVPAPPWPDDAKLAVQFVVNYEEGVSAVFYMAILNQKPFCQKSSVLHLGLASGIGTWNPYMNMARAQAFGGSLICSQLKIYLSLFLVWQPRLHVPLNRLQR